MKKLYIIIIASLLIFSCTSCSFLRRATGKDKQHHELITEKKSDSTGTKKIDSVHAVTSDSTGVKKSDSANESHTTIIFQDSSDHNTIEVKPDGTIKATGKIKSATTNHKQQITNTDSSHLLKKDTAAKTTQQASSVKSNEKQKKVDDTKSKTTTVKRTSLPWYVYLFLLLLLIGIIAWLYRKYKSPLLAFIQKIKQEIKQNNST
jgi:cobalamin biosynthesis Mg chelatase CobN